MPKRTPQELCRLVVKYRKQGHMFYNEGHAAKKDLQCEQICMCQLEKGIRVEKEHTKNEIMATKIATDHLAEFPNYYDALEDMERKLKRGKGVRRLE